MRIWILAKKQKFDTYENKHFILEAKKQNLKVSLVCPEDIEILEPRENKSTILYKHRFVSPPDCIIPRMGSGTNYFGFAILRQLEKLGVLVLNNAESIEKSKDKLHTVQVLANSSLPIPKTILARFPIKINFIEKEFHFPVVIKTISGSEGKGIALCENHTHLKDILEIIESSSEGKQNIIIQEFISSSRGKDIRVFVIGGRAVGAMLRTGKPESFKANFSAGGRVEKIGLSPALEWLAVESAKALGLEIAGVDILFDKDGYKICEVNSSPYFRGFEKATGMNIPQEIFNFVQLKTQGTLLK